MLSHKLLKFYYLEHDNQALIFLKDIRGVIFSGFPDFLSCLRIFFLVTVCFRFPKTLKKSPSGEKKNRE